MKFDINQLEYYHKNNLLIKQNHPELPLIIWNYSPKVQYEKLWDEITLKCRGLVTDLNGNVIAKSFDKFFNLEEEKNIPNEPFEVYEKLDGSLIIIFWYNDRLVVSSKGSFTSPHSKEALKIIKNYDTDKFEKDKTYCGELIARWNRIVCDYGSEEKVFILAKFDKDGNEYDIENYKDYFPIVKKHNGIKDLNDLKNSISDDKEGFVVRFKSGKRIKIKGLEYLRLHKIVTGVSNILIWESLKDNKPLDDILERVPDEFYNWVQKTKSELEDRHSKIVIWAKSNYKELETRKETAEYFLRQKHPSILFKMLDKKDPSDIIWKIIRPEFSRPFSEDQ
jgi:RNA ligase